MAGSWSPGCKGCSSTSCTCGGDKGKWGDSSLLGRRLSEDSDRHQLLQKWASIWTSLSGDPQTTLINYCYFALGVSCNVSVDKEQILSKRKNENGCVLETLYCSGCSLNLGHIYRCTPKSLDYKRDLFCLRVEAIESYILGSSEKQIVPEDKELFNLESRVEIEKSLKQMEDVLKALQAKLWEVESKLSFTSCKS
uniref:protein Mis18-alpha n=1 Tax=Panthera onca TaxID=9690 RepID=UPI002955BF06|nr:protein Mis18-alpha [Panthera onca]